jgi:hypothetical protein
MIQVFFGTRVSGWGNVILYKSDLKSLIAFEAFKCCYIGVFLSYLWQVLKYIELKITLLISFLELF